MSHIYSWPRSTYPRGKPQSQTAGRRHRFFALIKRREAVSGNQGCRQNEAGAALYSRRPFLARDPDEPRVQPRPRPGLYVCFLGLTQLRQVVDRTDRRLDVGAVRPSCSSKGIKLL